MIGIFPGKNLIIQFYLRNIQVYENQIHCNLQINYSKNIKTISFVIKIKNIYYFL